MRAEVCFDATTEGATGGMLGLLPTRLCSKAKGRARCNGRTSVAREKTRARVLGGKNRCPPVRLPYAKRGLVRIGRKDGKSTVLRPERGTKGPGHPEGCPGPLSVYATTCR